MRCAAIMWEEEVDKLPPFVAQSEWWEKSKPILPMFKLYSITLKSLFHLESRIVKSRLSYFHFSPWIMPSFSH